MIFTYDSSFEGLLTCVFEAYRLRVMPHIVATADYQEQLFDPPQLIVTDTGKASRVSLKLKAISFETFLTVQHCFLSSAPNKENLILKYIQQALIVGKYVNNNYADPAVGAAIDCMRTVTFEAHRFKGFLRFQELADGSWYAACEPDHCILPLLATHCRERFGNQDWFIHDVKRDMLMVYKQGKTELFTQTDLIDERGEPRLAGKLSVHEQAYQALWKTFFKNIAITERKNPKLQRQFMPQKYWKYLVEKAA